MPKLSSYLKESQLEKYVTIDVSNNVVTPNDLTVTGDLHGVDKAMVGLSQIDNTSDVNKPISSAQLTALNAKADTTTVNNALAVKADTTAVTAQIDGVIAAAPGALDTLNELAAALGDDPNFATTITNLLATKANLADPTFTGITTIPTLDVITLNVDGESVSGDNIGSNTKAFFFGQ